MTGIPDLSISVEAGAWPPEAVLVALARRAVEAAVAVIEEGVAVPPPLLSPARGEGVGLAGEVSIVFTDDVAMRGLNAQWRGKDRATNVLSFPQAAAAPGSGKAGESAEAALLGDIVLGFETIRDEAALADKPLEDHLSHLIIHGFLHLLGHDHGDDADAENMEQLERLALQRIGIADPYGTAYDR